MYWILFPIHDLRQAVETAKRILTKEEIDRQLSGQSSSAPFMSIKDNHNRRVTFDTGDELGDKVDKLTVMIGKVAARDSGQCTWQSQQNKFWRRPKTRTFKLIEGKNDPTTFLPLITSIGGQVNSSKSNDNNYLSEEQARHVYKKVESGNVINKDMLQQETEQEWELNRIDDTSGDVNLHRKLIVNNAEEIEPILTQMKQWSILSNVLNYIQYKKHPKNYHSLSISPVKKENVEEFHI